MRKLMLASMLLLPLLLAGQDYSTSVGGRGGYSSGITFKGFLDEYRAVEAMLSWRGGGMQFTMLAQSYRPVMLEYSDHLFLFAGYGAHVGYTRWYTRHTGSQTIYGHPTYFYSRRSSPVIGADAILGLEYRMYRVPLAMSLDLKPYLELFGERFVSIMPVDMAFSLRYTF
ncbi:MAG TPA: hypothetical protein P5550_10760 [Bacteroidales bacterium]|nr:hypothetical protein [Bacteroidales bacterium]HRZ78004.1 hypothetical protein [Bacteroidales bacterium]